MKNPKSFFQQRFPKEFEPAVFHDKQKIVGVVHFIVCVTCIVSGSVMYFYDMKSYLSLLLLGLVCFGGWLLNRAGHPKISAVILLVALLIAIQYNIFQGYGMHDVAIIAWPTLIFFAGLLFGWRVIPYFTALIVIMAVMTKVFPNAQNFTGYADTGDLIVLLLILVGFNFVGMAILRGNEHSILALRESEERYRQLYENSTVGLYRTTPDGQILLANPAMVRMMGFSSFEDVSSRNLEKEGYAPDYDRAHFIEVIEQNGEVKGFETFWTRRDGTTIYVRDSAHVTRDEQGKTLYYDGIIEDVTEHKRLEDAVKQSEAKYRRMIETTNEGVIVFDRDTRMTLINQQAASMLGYTIEELLGRKLESLLFEEDLGDHQVQMQLRSQGKSSVLNLFIAYGIKRLILL